MKQPKYGKYLCVFGGVCAFGLLVVLLLVAVADPFFQYHKPVAGLDYIIDNQLEQNPGMAKNFDYDSVILGSSMTVNFNPDVFAETMGLNTLKLSSNAAFPKDIDNIMQIVSGREETVKQIFLGVDVYNYKAEPGITAYPLPEHLYDDNLLNDVYYIFNKDVILEYILKSQLKGESTPLNEIYYTWRDMKYGREHVAASGYAAPEFFAESVPVDIYADNVAENLENYIIPYIEAMPDTEFTVFFPPYSILYWYTRMGEGTAQAELQAERQIVETLLVYPNVRIFYFQNQYDYMTNLDNYCDYTHYNHDMNDYMTACFADGTGELTAENYAETLAEMEEYILNFDYESVWP